MNRGRAQIFIQLLFQIDSHRTKRSLRSALLLSLSSKKTSLEQFLGGNSFSSFCYRKLRERFPVLVHFGYLCYRQNGLGGKKMLYEYGESDAW